MIFITCCAEQCAQVPLPVVWVVIGQHCKLLYPFYCEAVAEGPSHVPCARTETFHGGARGWRAKHLACRHSNVGEPSRVRSSPLVRPRLWGIVLQPEVLLQVRSGTDTVGHRRAAVLMTRLT